MSCWPAAPPPELYRAALEPLADRSGSSCHVFDSGGARRSWFVFPVQLPRGVDRDDTIRMLGSRGVPSKPYFPAVHLMSYYRERWGHREGEFPVCEDVAARSIALPFFGGITASQVERVAGALHAVLDTVGSPR